MEGQEQVTAPEYMPPILDISGHFISANQFRLKEREEKKRFKTSAMEIAARNNERLARKMDAAKFLDEAKRGLWNDPKVPNFQILKRSYDNQAFHFKDEKK